MVTILEDKIFADGKHYVKGVCLSTDTKPDDVCNGSEMYEMDTTFRSFYDEEGEAWTTAGE